MPVNLRNKHPGLTIDGVTKSYRQWSLETGLSESVVWMRVNRLGWTGERILSKSRLAHTPERRKDLSVTRHGELNPNWNGGPKTAEQKAKYCRQWRKSNESHVRDREYQKRFGITLEDYEALLRAQNGLCAICSKPCNRGRLSVDHDHLTGKVRGLLCRRCNVAIGMFSDNPEWIKKAEVYLASKK